jgi:hypothetical protein
MTEPIGARDPWSERLSEYLDGEMDAAARVAIERHLAGCHECTRLLADLRRVVDHAQTLEDTPPAEDLWSGIAAQIEPRTKIVRPPAGWWTRRFDFSMPQLAAAGIVLVGLSAAAVWLALRSPAGGVPAPATSGSPIAAIPPAESVATSPAPARTPGAGTTVVSYGSSSANAGYDAAVAELEQTLAEGRGRLDPRTLHIVEQNLRVIDRALTEARQAVTDDPGNAWLRMHLAATMKRKVDLLRSVTLLASAQS